MWTEKARPAEVCRQLSVNWITLGQWQQRAMEGMLQALESRVNLKSGQALSPRLQALLSKRQHFAVKNSFRQRIKKARLPLCDLPVGPGYERL